MSRYGWPIKWYIPLRFKIIRTEYNKKVDFLMQNILTTAIVNIIACQHVTRNSFKTVEPISWPTFLNKILLWSSGNSLKFYPVLLHIDSY